MNYSCQEEYDEAMAGQAEAEAQARAEEQMEAEQSVLQEKEIIPCEKCGYNRWKTKIKKEKYECRRCGFIRNNKEEK